jgi:hypothetical protein
MSDLRALPGSVSMNLSPCMQWNRSAMIKILSRLWALSMAFQALSPVFAADKPIHLFILSGQSNMAGMNPALGFEPELARAFPDAETASIKIAVGGRPIRQWVKEWNDIAGRHGVGVQFMRPTSEEPIFYGQILSGFSSMLKEHPQPSSVTFCWMQGERDASEKLDAAYAEALRQLIANLRRDLNHQEMNVVIGRVSDFGAATDISWQNIRAAQVEVARTDPRGAWIDCDDLNDKVQGGQERNDLHYTRAGYELLGRRFVRQAEALITGRIPADNGRPE